MEFLSSLPVIQDTDNRYVVFNNKEEDVDKKGEQVRTLLLAVRDLLHAVDDKHFSNPFLLRCQETVMTNASQLADMLEGTHTRYELLFQISSCETVIWKLLHSIMLFLLVLT